MRILFVLAALFALAAPLPGSAPRRAPPPPRAPVAPPVVHQGRTFVWDDALEKYRPLGAGWYWDAPSGCWCRDVPAPSGPNMASYPPPTFAPPGAFAAPMFGGGCAGGGCGAPAPGRRR
jgi:hypothetical protein